MSDRSRIVGDHSDRARRRFEAASASVAAAVAAADERLRSGREISDNNHARLQSLTAIVSDAGRELSTRIASEQERCRATRSDAARAFAAARRDQRRRLAVTWLQRRWRISTALAVIAVGVLILWVRYG